MARFKEIIDVYFTDSGDFMLGNNKDIKDTELDHFRGFYQKIYTRIASRKREWATQETVGAGTTAVLGKPNTAETGNLLKSIIQSELISDGLLRAGEFIVDVFPVSSRMLAVAIVITPPRSGGQIVLSFTYDLRDNRMIPRNF